jgi:hypothetical protein
MISEARRTSYLQIKSIKCTPDGRIMEIPIIRPMLPLSHPIFSNHSLSIKTNNTLRDLPTIVCRPGDIDASRNISSVSMRQACSFGI